MKRYIAVICLLVLSVGVLFAFTGCDFETDSNSKLTVANENISIEYNEYLGYSVKITGSITNTSKNNLSYISVEYKIYDNLGAVIGTALANANSIGAGETWKFEAVSLGWFDNRPSKVTFNEIQTIKEF